MVMPSGGSRGCGGRGADGTVGAERPETNGRMRPREADTPMEKRGRPRAVKGSWARASAVCLWKAASPMAPIPATSVATLNRQPEVGTMGSLRFDRTYLASVREGQSDSAIDDVWAASAGRR
eukprot:scaffold325300_cov66-Tisochrysis_lutea.AAC.3